jgi:hypothetical protein
MKRNKPLVLLEDWLPCGRAHTKPYGNVRVTWLTALVSFQRYWRSSGIANEREGFRRDKDLEPQSRVLTRKLGCLGIERQAEKRLFSGK